LFEKLLEHRLQEEVVSEGVMTSFWKWSQKLNSSGYKPDSPIAKFLEKKEKEFIT
jgi:hypothetical protein